MATGYFLRVGDKSMCGGQILTGDPTLSWYGVAGAREGDMVSCGKHSGHFYILGGCDSVWDEGRKVAGTLESVSSCPCHARFINSIQDCYSAETHDLDQELLSSIVQEVPVVVQKHHIRYRCLNDDGKPLVQCSYHIYLPDIEVLKGKTDDYGYTQFHDSNKNGKAIIHLLMG